ncbi:hypothetical protein ACFZBU_39545 [Embleya sp. NPDC008237]|uniref:hypothetical protein n=1 Tax=Embleya sp. NPDC008237 TaxID=3363978 RepID=UPI0036E640D5
MDQQETKEQNPRTARRHTRIRAGHYLQVDACHTTARDVGYARVEHVEHLPAAMLLRGLDAPPAPERPSPRNTAVVVWCQGVPGALLLHPGNHHRTLVTVPGEHLEHDERHPTLYPVLGCTDAAPWWLWPPGQLPV